MGTEDESAERKLGRWLAVAATWLSLPVLFLVALIAFGHGFAQLGPDVGFLLAVGAAGPTVVLLRAWVRTGARTARATIGGAMIAVASWLVVSGKYDSTVGLIVADCAFVAFVLLGSRSARVYFDDQRRKRRAIVSVRAPPL